MNIPNLKADLIAQFKTDRAKLIALAIITAGTCVTTALIYAIARQHWF
jgi:hypothetical protein